MGKEIDDQIGHRTRIYADRLLLYMSDYQHKSRHGSIVTHTYEEPKDVTLADGFVGTVEYLHAMHLLDGKADRQSAIAKIGGLTEGEVRAIAMEVEPKHRGKAIVFWADVSENGGVLVTHAQSRMYELGAPEEAKAQ